LGQRRLQAVDYRHQAFSERLDAELAGLADIFLCAASDVFHLGTRTQQFFVILGNVFLGLGQLRLQIFTRKLTVFGGGVLPDVLLIIFGTFRLGLVGLFRRRVVPAVRVVLFGMAIVFSIRVVTLLQVRVIFLAFRHKVLHIIHC